MKDKKNLVLIVIIVIIVLLTILCSSLVKNNLSSKTNQTTKKKETEINEEPSPKKEEEPQVETTEKYYSKEYITSSIREKLTNYNWIKENLYSKVDCFNNQVGEGTQELYFVVLSDENDNPFVIVSNDTDDKFIRSIYKVYFKDREVLVKNITGNIGHPGHIYFEIDKDQGIVAGIWGHMGNYKFTAYNVKNEEIEIYDEYSCQTGDCEYEYKGEKEYNLSPIDIKLTTSNINKYL